jgi:hypothetical protein
LRKEETMRLLSRVGVAALMAGLLVLSVGRAMAGFVPADLHGTWTGTYTPLTNPTPTSLSPSGTTDYAAPAGFFDPTPMIFTFSPSTQFDFDFGFSDPSAPPGYFLPVTQTAGSATGNAFAAEHDFFVKLSDGTMSKVGTENFSGLMQADASNPAQMDLTGSWVVTAMVTALPSNTTSTATTFTADFALTQQVDPVSLPGALWSSLSLLGGLGCIWFVRRWRASTK